MSKDLAEMTNLELLTEYENAIRKEYSAEAYVMADPNREGGDWAQRHAKKVRHAVFMRMSGSVSVGGT